MLGLSSSSSLASSCPLRAQRVCSQHQARCLRASSSSRPALRQNASRPNDAAIRFHSAARGNAPSARLQNHLTCHARRYRADDGPESQASNIAKTVTIMIRDASSLQDLEDVVDEWGSSFNHINVSAAFTKAAKLAGNRSASASPLVKKLRVLWTAVQSDAGTQALANVLWASSKLRCYDARLWNSTLEAFLQKHDVAANQELSNVAYALAVIDGSNRGSVPGLTHEELCQAVTLILEQAYFRATHPLLEGVKSQELTNLLWACGKLRINPGDTELAAFLRALARPQMLEDLTAHGLANVVYAVGTMCQHHSLHGVAERVWQKLLGEEQLCKLAQSTAQPVANTLIGIARMATCDTPVLSVELATHTASRLLARSAERVAHWVKWDAQGVANSMWACGKLGVQESAFIEAVVATVPFWIGQSTPAGIKQIAWACGQLGIANDTLMLQLLRRSEHLLTRPAASAPSANILGLAGVVAESISTLDMRSLAGDVFGLCHSKALREILASNRLQADPGSWVLVGFTCVAVWQTPPGW